MTTMTSTAAAVIGGVDTHADVHVAAACDRLGAVLGTQAFPTTAAQWALWNGDLVKSYVFEALGVAIDLGPAGVARCVEEAGVGFCFAQRFHSALRHAAAARRELP